MERPTSVRVKMKYLDKMKVGTLEGYQSLSSVESMKKLIYKSFPELEEQCQDSVSLVVHAQCENGDGNLVAVEKDGDLESAVNLKNGNNFIVHLIISTKKRDPEAGSWRRRDTSSNASSSTPRSTRIACCHYNQGKGYCKYGASCHFAHDGILGPRSSKLTLIPVDLGSWLRQQYERDPNDNVTFLSRGEGFHQLTKIVGQKNLPTVWIDLLVKLLTREEFRLSLMREDTNKVYGLLLGSTFLLQLNGHVITQLRKASPQDIMPYLLLMEQLQSRTADGWKEVPLDAMNQVIQQLEESGGKKELVMMVNRLLDHRKKLRRHALAVLSPAGGENPFQKAEFRNMSIFPDKKDMLQPHLSSDLPVNLVGRRYKSTLNYLETHFRLLREDFIDPLRQGICAYRNEQIARELSIYQEARLIGYRCGQETVEYCVSFQHGRRDWEASKRLLYGALVCLSDDGFQNSIIFGVVTQNPESYGATRYTVNLRLISSSEVQGEQPITRDRTYVMVESTSAYYEAYYHVLKSLQGEDMENLPFRRYLLGLKKHVDPPFYLLSREAGDEFDFEPVFPSINSDIGRSLIHILQEWPQWQCSLDEAQLQALKHGLTKELSIIQGPPGTGKTFLGLILVKLLLANFKTAEERVDSWNCIGRGRKVAHINDENGESYGNRRGPILVICMTNHALDQFLEGIYGFEQNLIRLGGRSKSCVLQERTLKKVLEDERTRYGDGNTTPSQYNRKCEAWKEKVSLEDQIRECLDRSNAELVSQQELRGIATSLQMRNIFSIGLNSKETLKSWLRGDTFPTSVYLFQEDNPKYYEDDFESEYHNKRSGQLIAITRPAEERRGSLKRTNVVEAGGSEDDDEGEEDEVFHQFEAMDLSDTPRDNLLPEGNEEETDKMDRPKRDLQRGELDKELEIKSLVNFSDVWQLSQEQRRVLHDVWLRKVKIRYRRQLRELTEEYEETCRVINAIDEETKLSRLRKANVVGITTTTAARCRKILQALNSEILIVEEAAEVLEAQVLAGLTSCIKHLVLIGDHMQLRPSIAVHELSTKYKLDVSMFERLVSGGVEHVALQEQRRMRPSFSKLVRSLYPNLKDHESVATYENIKGVNCDLLFFHHTAEENSTTVDTSKLNTTEAQLVVELTLYLLKQDCYSAENIAILTMYRGQITEIKRILKEKAFTLHAKWYWERMRRMHGGWLPEGEDHLLPRVSSVDDFQGEEADIIILSLVRSNDTQTNEGEGTIGFLKTSNRICVALTRAKKGMYIFGNATLLADRSDLWSKVIFTLRMENALDTKLELVCQNHPETITTIREVDDFNQVAGGGCSRTCGTLLECGHVCPRLCHFGSHEDVVCAEICSRRYSDCEHTCPQVCHGRMACPPCKTQVLKTFAYCGHIQRMSCHKLLSEETCQTMCVRILECGHACTRVCGVPCNFPWPPCEMQVIKTFVVCGHAQRMKCFKDPAEETCRTPCAKTLDCGHDCKSFCGNPCAAKCEERVTRTLACGHEIKLPCHLDVRTYKCQEPCTGLLSGCAHECQGSCSLCKFGTEHIPCKQKCGRILPCGHACEAGCSAPCPPCKKNCQKRCAHGRCRLPCGRICVPCKEPCAWQCEHHRCRSKCHEICTRPRCDIPCKKILRCGHLCIGLCGEPCPAVCRTCDADTLECITERALEEFQETDRFHQLEECKHLFEVSRLDAWMDSDEMDGVNSTSVAVKLKDCPKCKVSVWRSFRYTNVVKTKLDQLESVKKKIYAYEKTRQGRLRLKQGRPANALLLITQALDQNPTLMEAAFGAGRALHESKRFFSAAVFLSLFVKKSSYATQVGSVLRDTDDLDKMLGVSKADCPSPKDDLAVKAMLQLASTFTALAEFISSEKLCNAVIERHPENEDARTIKEDAKKGLVAHVVQAMSEDVGERGHWYQCPNGHFYAVEKCGGALELSSICQDCRGAAGEGQQIRTIGYRWIDGAPRPAWTGSGH